MSNRESRLCFLLMHGRDSFQFSGVAIPICPFSRRILPYLSGIGVNSPPEMRTHGRKKVFANGSESFIMLIDVKI